MPHHAPTVDTSHSNLITVATMNYGLWNDGVTKYVEDSKVEQVLAAWKRMLDAHDADILAGQEWLYYFDRSNRLVADQCLFSYKYPYRYTTSTGHGKSLVSKTECTDYEVRDFSNGTGRQYTCAYTVMDGKRVCLLNAHCSLEKNFQIHRKTEFEELVRVMNGEECAILFGDFNAYSVEEFELFTKAGYTIANGGVFGAFDTWTNFDKPSSWTNRAIDNIIVSAGIQIQSVTVDRRDLSDHSMLIAQLIL
jgi:endonuclease/exonuclease/phosphatase family metal-dependent hydrolase